MYPKNRNVVTPIQPVKIKKEKRGNGTGWVVISTILGVALGITVWIIIAINSIR